MKKLTLIISLVLSFTTMIQAQDLKIKYTNGKYGFIDNTGKEIIPPKYDFAREFSEGLAYVKLKNKSGFIDNTGREVIPLKYENTAWSFSEGLAYVKVNGKYGFIDKTGAEIIPPKYEEAGGFQEGLSYVKLNNKYGFIDRTDKEIIPLKYESAGDFEEGLAFVELNRKYGYIDRSGNTIIEMKYDKAGDFQEGLAVVRKGGYFDGKYGFIDKTGNEVIPFNFDKASSFNKGSASVERNGRKFYIDYWGEEVPSYYSVTDIGYKPKADLTKTDKLFSPSEGMQLAMDKSTRKYGFLNEKNIIVIPFIFSTASSFGNNRAPVTLNGRRIYIDKTGKEVINAEKYKYAQVFYNGFAVVENDRKMRAFIDTTGKLMTDFVYSKADGFGNGLAAVCKDDKCGFLGLDFKPAIPLKFRHVDYFTESGLAHVVTMQGKHGYINEKGGFVIPAIYDDASIDWNLISNNPRSGWPYHSFMVRLGAETKYLDASGKDVTPQKPVENATNVMKTEPDAEIKTKTHSLKVYAGWAGIFKNPEKQTGLRSDYGNKKPSEVFKEAPDGWLKNESSLYSLQINFSEIKSSSLEKAKQSFISLAIRRSGWTKEKIKLTEEKITLPDGRKGIILFYVCPDSKGMVGGNYFDCELSVESGKDKNDILSYVIFMDGGAPTITQKEAVAWKDYFKKVLLTIRPN